MSPFFIRPILSRVRSTINDLVLDPDIKAIVGVLKDEIKRRQWFMGGNEPSRADFALRFSVDLAVHPKYVDLSTYPALLEWMRRCEAREAWHRSLAAGNGYGLDFRSRW